MTLIPELKEHISKGSPKSKGVLTKAANKMSEAQQREFLASLQFGDAEFQLSVAPYMPKGSTIDPSRARLQAFPKEAGVGPEGLSLKGVSTKNVTDPEQLKSGKYRGYELDFEPDTVTAVEAANANPRVFAHEYRHFEDTDGLEMINRIQDLMASQNLEELTDNTRMLAEAGISRAGVSDEKMGKLYRDLYNATINSSEEEAIGAAKALMQSPKIVELMDMGVNAYSPELFPDVRKKAALGPYFKRTVLGNTDATEMPKEFRAGGRTRLI